MKCPGQDMQFWDSDAIYEVKCPECGHMVEFYKDDTTRKCGNCEHRFVNPKMDFGCASYCQFAEQCLGSLPEDFVSQRENLFKDKVAVAVKKHLHRDFKRIRLTTKVADHAEKIGKTLESENLVLILCTAYLFLVSNENEASCQDLAEKDPHPPQAGKDSGETAISILNTIGANQELIDQICRILTANAGENEAEWQVLQIVKDAYTITFLEEKYKEHPEESGNIQSAIDQLSSEAARQVAKRIF